MAIVTRTALVVVTTSQRRLSASAEVDADDTLIGVVLGSDRSRLYRKSIFVELTIHPCVFGERFLFNRSCDSGQSTFGRSVAVRLRSYGFDPRPLLASPVPTYSGVPVTTRRHPRVPHYRDRNGDGRVFDRPVVKSNRSIEHTRRGTPLTHHVCPTTRRCIDGSRGCDVPGRRGSPQTGFEPVTFRLTAECSTD